MRLPKNGSNQVWLSYLALEVTYVEAGYGEDVIGVAAASIGKVNGVATANVGKVSGV